jgi:hypothetical protein
MKTKSIRAAILCVAGINNSCSGKAMSVIESYVGGAIDTFFYFLACQDMMSRGMSDKTLLD